MKAGKNLVVEILIQLFYIVCAILIYIFGQKAVQDDQDGGARALKAISDIGTAISNRESDKTDIKSIATSIKQTAKDTDTILDDLKESWSSPENPNYFSIISRLFYADQWEPVTWFNIKGYWFVFAIILILIVSFLPALVKLVVYYFNRIGNVPSIPKSPVHLAVFCIFIVLVIRLLYYTGFKIYAILNHRLLFLTQGKERFKYIPLKHPDPIASLIEMKGLSLYTGIIWTVLPCCSVQYAQKLLLNYPSISKNKYYQDDKNQVKFISVNMISTIFIASFSLLAWWLITSKLLKQQDESIWLAGTIFFIPFVIAPIIAAAYIAKYKSSNELYCEVQTVATIALVIICFIIYSSQVFVSISKWNIPLAYILMVCILGFSAAMWASTPSLRKPDAKTRTRQNLMPPKPKSDTTFPSQFRIQESNTKPKPSE